MSYQPEQGKETLRAGIIYVLFSCAISVPLAVSDTSPSEAIFINVDNQIYRVRD